MSSQIDKIHEFAGEKADQWSFGDDYLDTDVIRGISYGNLFLRKQSHLYLVHGVIVAVLLLGGFWVASANWDILTSWTGFFEKEEESTKTYKVITSVTQLPPPPPIEKPPPPKPIPKAAPLKPKAPPPNVGKIKKVKKEEAPPEQTFATQKEIKKAIQEGSADGAGDIYDGPVFVPVEIMPSFKSQKKPRYPETARRASIEGKVFVSVLVSEKGLPIKAQVMKRVPSDQTVFDRSAIEAVMNSKYNPGIQNGTPIKVWLTVPIRFTLRD